jgi:hypothetical protein
METVGTAGLGYSDLVVGGVQMQVTLRTSTGIRKPHSRPQKAMGQRYFFKYLTTASVRELTCSF